MAISTFAAPVCFLCVPDERATPSAITKTLPAGATTSATEDNLELEVLPTDGNITDQNGMQGARPVATGTPSSSSLSLTVDVNLPGKPDSTATYTYTQSSVEYGATPIYIPTGTETIVGVTSGDGYQNPKAAALPNGRLVAVGERTLGTDGIVVYHKDEGEATWTTAADSPIWTTSTAFTSTVRPCPAFFQVPSDTSPGVVLYMATLEVTDTNTQTLRLDYSKDGGDNWENAGYANLTFTVSSITYTIEDICYDDLAQQVVLVIRKLDGATYTLRTYVSNDFGMSWTHLSAADVSDIRIARLGFFAGNQYLISIDGSNNLDCRRRTASSASWSTRKAAIASTAMSTSHLGFVISPAGHLFVYVRLNTDARVLSLVASSDGGATWGAMASSTSGTTVPVYPFNSGASQPVGTDHASSGALVDGLNVKHAIYTHRTVYLIGDLTSSNTVDLSLMVMKCGGISNIPWSDSSLSGTSIYPAAVASTKSTNYTFTTGGATTDTLAIDASGQLVERFSNDNSTGYNADAYANATNAAHWIFGASSSGGSTAASNFVLRISATDTTTNYVQAEIRIDATNRQLQLYDLVAAANRGSAVTYASGAPVELFIAISQTSGKVSAWYKLTTSTGWTAIATDQTAASAAGTTGQIAMGKLAANTAQVDTIWFRRLREDGLASGSRSLSRVGIPATTVADRLAGPSLNLKWEGSPLLAGNQWTVAARSTTPLAFTSPLSVAPSPTRQWVGTAGSAAATYRIVYDFGSSYRAKLSRNMVFIGWANAPGLTAVTLKRWDGSAWQTIATADPRSAWSSLGLGNTSIARENAASYQFYPGSNANENLVLLQADQLKGWWIVMNDGGGNVIAGEILRNDPGHFSTASPASLPASIELDPDTVTATSGSFSAFSLSTTTGTIYLYAPDGIGLGVQTSEATRYYSVDIILAPGATIPKAGLLTFGSAYAMARSPRDGSSMRWTSPDELRQIPGSGLMQGRRVRRKQGRVVEIPYDQILVHNGTFNMTGAAVQNVLSFNGSTPRATIDNNLNTIVSVHAMAGRRYPVGLVIDGDWQADPSSSVQNFVADDVVWGYLEDSVDITAGRGFLRPREAGPWQQGGSLVLTEIV